MRLRRGCLAWRCLGKHHLCLLNQLGKWKQLFFLNNWNQISFLRIAFCIWQSLITHIVNHSLIHVFNKYLWALPREIRLYCFCLLKILGAGISFSAKINWLSKQILQETYQKVLSGVTVGLPLGFSCADCACWSPIALPYGGHHLFILLLVFSWSILFHLHCFLIWPQVQ